MRKKNFKKKLVRHFYEVSESDFPIQFNRQCSQMSVAKAKMSRPATLKAYLGPFIYYGSTFLEFFGPTNSLRQHKYSTERQQKWPFCEPTHPVHMLT